MRSLRNQLLASHLLLVALLVLALGVAAWEFRRIGRETTAVVTKNMEAALMAQETRGALREVQSGLAYLASGRPDLAQVPIQEGANRLQKYIASLSGLTDNAQEMIDITVLTKDLTRWEAGARRLYKSDEISPQPDTPPFAERLIQEGDMLGARLGGFGDENQRQVSDDAATARASFETAQIRLAIVAGVAIVLALLLAFRLVKAALTPLAVIARRAERIGEGEYEDEPLHPRPDEIGALADSVNEMALKLSEVRRAEVRKLERAMRMSDAALDSLYDPVLVTDARMRVLFLNRAAEGLFGAIPNDIRPPLEQVVSDKRVREAVRQAVDQRRETARDDVAGLVELGGRIYRLRATPMTPEEGDRLLGAVVVLEDVTHVRALDKLKTEFIGVASHELRTPVTSMLLATELMKDEAVGPLNDAQREIVSAQMDDLRRLERLMKDLLDVTRLESGATPPRFEAVLALDLVSAPAQGVRPQAEEKGVTVSWSAADDLPPVRADRGQVGRVITNLLVNAVRHTPAGGEVSVRAASDPGGGVRITVADTGEGIPAEYLAKIFGRFVQVPGATGGGAGLGLSIAQNILRAHGSELSVASDVGQGSTFWFVLPSALTGGESDREQ